MDSASSPAEKFAELPASTNRAAHPAKSTARSMEYPSSKQTESIAAVLGSPLPTSIAEGAAETCKPFCDVPPASSVSAHLFHRRASRGLPLPDRLPQFCS